MQKATRTDTYTVQYHRNWSGWGPAEFDGETQLSVEVQDLIFAFTRDRGKIRHPDSGLDEELTICLDVEYTIEVEPRTWDYPGSISCEFKVTGGGWNYKGESHEMSEAQYREAAEVLDTDIYESLQDEVAGG